MIKRAPFVLLALGAVACHSRVPHGGSILADREFEIKNDAQEAICSIDILNIQALRPEDNRSEKVNIAAGAETTIRIKVASDQDRKFIFKTCEGKVLKEWPLQFQPSKAHVDVP